MISRYEIPEISSLWSEEEKFHHYLTVELNHLKTLEEEKIAPEGSVAILKTSKINLQRIKEIEKITQHDVIAFCTSITEQLPPEFSRFFHYGLTSSDIIDTAHALLIKKSMIVIKKDLTDLKRVLRQKAIETKDLICLGRSHGISAEAMIFGQKFLSFEAEVTRRLCEWEVELNNLTGKLSGAVGNYTVITPSQEQKTLERLGLKCEEVSSQVIPRDRYAKIISLGALLSALFERMATEFRLLQHSDVSEVFEGFSRGQKGSSTMPHKKNPISSENLTGIARLLRSHLTPMLENCALWHERDISHSSVERMILPDHFGLLSYATRRMKNVVENLFIDRKQIEAKVEANEKIFSSYLLHQLIEFNPKQSREELYDLVQSSFFSAENQDELKIKIKKELTSKNAHYDFKNWPDLKTMKAHYQANFEILLQRLDSEFS